MVKNVSVYIESAFATFRAWYLEIRIGIILYFCFGSYEVEKGEPKMGTMAGKFTAKAKGNGNMMKSSQRGMHRINMQYVTK